MISFLSNIKNASIIKNMNEKSPKWDAQHTEREKYPLHAMHIVENFLNFLFFESHKLSQRKLRNEESFIEYGNKNVSHKERNFSMASKP